jgi:nitroimidazol reductase NimA-like FMN-containing flavoprotein (pyridoxamine 5'-phosphate oxidase superfamily)
MSTFALPTDRSGLQVLSIEDCLFHLGAARIGRVAFMSDGHPIILPVTHGMDGYAVVFRTNVGSKLAAADNELPVAFEVDGIDADRRAGWSVLVRGVARTVEDPDEVARLYALRIWPWADAVRRSHWVRISTSEMTGRKIVHNPMA